MDERTNWLQLSKSLGNKVHSIITKAPSEVCSKETIYNFKQASKHSNSAFQIDISNSIIRLNVYDALCHIVSTINGSGSPQIRRLAKNKIKELKLYNSSGTNNEPTKKANGKNKKKK